MPRNVAGGAQTFGVPKELDKFRALDERSFLLAVDLDHPDNNE